MMKLQVQYYRSYPMDVEAEYPVIANLGRTQTTLDLAPEKVVVAGMHLWNLGEEGAPDLTPNGPDWNITQMYGFYKQAGQVMREKIKPIFKTARHASIPVFHIAGSRYGHKYGPYQETLKKYGPAQEIPGCIDRSWMREDYKNRFGPTFTPEEMSRVKNKLKIAKCVEPAPQDKIIINAEQFNGYLRDLKVDTIIYTGFCACFCLLFAPGGIMDMIRLGYRIIAVRDATSGQEEKDTIPQEENQKWAMRIIEHQYGYTCSTADLIAAMSATK